MAPTTRTPTAVPARRGPTFPRVLAAERTKLTSLRATLWTALGTVPAAAALAYALGMFVRPGDERSWAALAVSGVVLAQLGALVQGVLVGTGEYSTGTYRATFTAVPRRLPVLAAQVLVTLVLAAVTAVGALLASVLVTAGRRVVVGPVDVTDPETARLLAGFLLYQAGVALLGLGLGALLRRATPAVVTGVVLLVVLDQVLTANPGRFADTARALLPGAGARLAQDDAHLALLDATTAGPDLGTWGGGVVLGAWALVVLAAAAHRLRHHDVP